MKILALILFLMVGVMAGVLVFTSQSGYLPMQKPPVIDEILMEGEEPEESAPVTPLISSRIGLIDELVESLQVAHDELEASKLRLGKREDNLQELYSTYLKLRQEVESLIDDLDSRLIRVSDSELINFKKLSGVYSKMDAGSAAQSLKHVPPERVALILSQMDSRAMAAIMDSAVSASSDGGETVAQWSDAIRRMNEGDGPEGR